MCVDCELAAFGLGLQRDSSGALRPLAFSMAIMDWVTSSCVERLITLR
jgi:hypothetical protein